MSGIKAYRLDDPLPQDVLDSLGYVNSLRDDREALIAAENEIAMLKAKISNLEGQIAYLKQLAADNGPLDVTL